MFNRFRNLLRYNMSKLIKLQKPKFLGDFTEIDNIKEEIYLEERILEKKIENELVEDLEEIGLTIDSCIFKNVVFSNCYLNKVDIVDVRFENCDLSNIDFTGGGIYRAEFINCKLVGARFDECSLRDVLFKECNGKYSNFSFGKFNGVNILDSNFEEATLQQVKHNKLALDNSDFTNGFFSKTSLEGIDLSTCNIQGIDIGIEDIGGATVTAVQALDLTRLMRLNLK